MDAPEPLGSWLKENDAPIDAGDRLLVEQAAALGWIIFGEALGLIQVLGGVLILIGIWIGRPRHAAADGVAA